MSFKAHSQEPHQETLGPLRADEDFDAQRRAKLSWLAVIDGICLGRNGRVQAGLGVGVGFPYDILLFIPVWSY